jgi:hypothetical protein
VGCKVKGQAQADDGGAPVLDERRLAVMGRAQATWRWWGIGLRRARGGLGCSSWISSSRRRWGVGLG